MSPTAAALRRSLPAPLLAALGLLLALGAAPAAAQELSPLGVNVHAPGGTQLATLDDVVAHYDRAPAAPFGHSELRPLRLSAAERRQLVAFLRTLSGPLSAPAGHLAPPAR